MLRGQFCPLRCQLPLEFRQRRHDAEHHPSARCPGIDPLGKRLELHLALAEAGHNLDQVLQRPAQAVQLPDHQRVVRSEMLKRFFQLGAIPAGTGDTIGVYRVAAGFFQGLDLVLGVLVQGRDPRIADALRQAFRWLRQKDSRTSILNLLWITILCTLAMLVNHTFSRWVGELYKRVLLDRSLPEYPLAFQQERRSFLGRERCWSMPGPEKTLHRGTGGFFVARIRLKIVLADRWGVTCEREF